MLSAAFEQGVLSWTQLRLLVAVARAETEQAWLAIARERTVRALETIIRDANARARVADGTVAPPVGDVSSTDTLEDCAEGGPMIEGEPTVTLRDHHILFRSRGGDNARDNRITLCAWHHLRGVHGGRVRAWGAAPTAVHWELGVRHDGPPLLRLVGERCERAQGMVFAT